MRGEVWSYWALLRVVCGDALVRCFAGVLTSYTTSFILLARAYAVPRALWFCRPSDSMPEPCTQFLRLARHVPSLEDAYFILSWT
jgi:hypothetical protein